MKNNQAPAETEEEFSAAPAGADIGYDRVPVVFTTG
jgi:hypothetical protein